MSVRRSGWVARVLWIAGVALLSGCASIQVDVDVYKGALLNQKQIQVRRYAMLASSAKPVIQDMEKALLAKCASGDASCASLRFFLHEVLERFDDHDANGANVTACKKRASQQARDCAASTNRAGESAVLQRSAITSAPTAQVAPIAGLDTLTRAVFTALAAKDEIPLDHVRRLNEAYIEFAERILRVVDSGNVFNDDNAAADAPSRQDGEATAFGMTAAPRKVSTNGKASDNFKLQLSMLQSLANTILIHANDLSRQNDRDARATKRASIEEGAIERAFAVAPSEAFDRIVNRAVELAAPATSVAAGAAEASAGDAEKNGKPNGVNGAKAAKGTKGEAVAASSRDIQAQRDRMKKVLSGLRSDVLKPFANVAVGDERRVHAVLKQRLQDRGRQKLPAGSTVADLDRARSAVDRVAVGGPIDCGNVAGQGVGSGGQCSAASPLDAIDNLLSQLRAKRIQALSVNSNDAHYLQNAIDAALEQRASLVYLRPTSDYLHSVHSASDLQSANETQYRNMLDDWTRYVEYYGDDEKNEARQRELEKLYWQNINRVTLGGGGKTNFVLAKDDVGNWYVKAYSADPQPVFQSAVNLGLFNAGARMNVNLLRRFQLQSKVDESSDKAERATLQEELDRLDAIDSRPLLKLKGRYARQYEAQTRDVTVAIQKRMSDMPTTIAAAIDADKDKAGSCELDTLKGGVEPLDTGDLTTVLDEKPPATDTDAAVAERAAKLERAAHAALEQLFRYAVSSSKAIVESKAEKCDASWLRSAASRVRAKVVGAAVDLAQQRKLSVERYEGALMNITDVALQK